MDNDSINTLAYQVPGLTDEGQLFVEAALRKPPRRRVRSSPYSSASRIASVSQGLTIQAESATQEKLFVLLASIDEHTLWLVDQVPGVNRDAFGNVAAGVVTPDYLFLTTLGAFLVECKSATELARLRDKYPDEFQESRGLIEDLRFASFSERTGIRLYLFSVSESFNTLLANLECLHALSKKDCGDVNSLVQYCNRAEYCTLFELERVFGEDALYTVMSAFFDGLIRLPLLTDHLESSAAFRTDSRYRYSFPLEQFSVARMFSRGEGFCELLAVNTNLDSSLDIEINAALRNNIDSLHKLSVVKEFLADPKSRRWTSTEYRYIATYRAAIKDGVPPLRALASKRNGKNKGRRISDEVEVIVAEKIEAFYATNISPPITALAGEIAQACYSKGLTPPSYNTVRSRVGQISASDLCRKRDGQKRAKSRYTRKSMLAKRKAFSGERAKFLSAQLDSTPIDLHLINPVDGTRLPPCELTMLRDVSTNKPLSYSICVGRASGEDAVACIIDCARKWGRLPSEICVDNGSIFISNAFELALADYSVDKVERALSQPQAGGQIVEGGFSALLRGFINTLPGNKQRDRLFRQLYKKDQSKEFAEITIYEFADLLEELWDLPNTQRHLHKTIKEPGDESHQYGRRVSDQVRLLRHRLARTDRSYVIQANKGIHYMYDYYWHELFEKKGWEGRRVTVFVDGSDKTSIYVEKDSRTLIRCRNLGLAGFGQEDFSHLEQYSLARDLASKSKAKDSRVRVSKSHENASRVRSNLLERRDRLKTENADDDDENAIAGRINSLQEILEITQPHPVRVFQKRNSNK